MDIFKANNYEEIGGNNSEFEIEVAEGIDAQGSKVEVKEEPTIENVGDGAHDIPAEETTVEEPTVEESEADKIQKNTEEKTTIGENSSPDDVEEQNYKLEVNMVQLGLTEKGLDDVKKIGTVGEPTELSPEQELQWKKDKLLEYLCPDTRGIYEKGSIDTILSDKTDERKDEKGVYTDIDILTQIFNQAGIPFEQEQNIVIHETDGYVVYFMDGSKSEIIPDDEFPKNMVQQVFAAENKEDLINIINESQTQTHENDNKSIANAPVQSQSMDIGGR